MRKVKKTKKTESSAGSGNAMVQNILAFSASIFIAILLAKAGTFEKMIETVDNASIFGSLLAGLFFTSMITIAPATVVIGELAMNYNLMTVAFFATLGSVLGDIIIIFVIKDISENVKLPKHKGLRKFIAMLRSKKFKWITPAIGAIALAAPVPDEIGLTILGLTKVKLNVLIPLSFAFNFIGVLIIGALARGLF